MRSTIRYAVKPGIHLTPVPTSDDFGYCADFALGGAGGGIQPLRAAARDGTPTQLQSERYPASQGARHLAARSAERRPRARPSRSISFSEIGNTIFVDTSLRLNGTRA